MYIHPHMLPTAVMRSSLRGEQGWGSVQGKRAALRERLRRAHVGTQWGTLWTDVPNAHHNTPSMSEHTSSTPEVNRSPPPPRVRAESRHCVPMPATAKTCGRSKMPHAPTPTPHTPSTS
eukprot:GFKZ01011936.1.p1 GENE.GFKZ01011936.1~~GFKZ01011936.1.p1  ORF type:complete len:119 (-),score=1.87 GFKZ01011936.1:67-423(-)